jgi:predicted metal-binding protein
MEKYVQLAKELEMADARIISPDDVIFDSRVLLKCKWGCEQKPIKCATHGLTYSERIEMIKRYQNILIVHAHDAHELTKALLELERRAFLDGHYLAFAIRYCNYCKNCAVDQGKPCAFPEKVRPCEQIFGIDVYQTVQGLGFPINVLQNQNEVQNRYGFLLID